MTRAELQALQDITAVSTIAATIDMQEDEFECGTPCTPDGCTGHPNGMATLIGCGNFNPGEFAIEDAALIVNAVRSLPAMLAQAEAAIDLIEIVEGWIEQWQSGAEDQDAPGISQETNRTMWYAARAILQDFKSDHANLLETK